MEINSVVAWFKKQYRNLSFVAKKFTLPGLQKVPIYDVGVFYKNGLLQGAIGVRASAISFNFFLALIPGVIFIFGLIPFIPVPNFQTELIQLLKEVLPPNTFKTIEYTITDISLNRRFGLFSFGFVAALIFSTNAVGAMIAAFNASANILENRSWLSMRLNGIVLVFVMAILTAVATGLIVFGKSILSFLLENDIIHNKVSHILFVTGRWGVILSVVLTSISFLYYYAPSKRKKYTLFSPGSVIATFLMIITSLAFSYYINSFDNYNKLYGSIGTLIAFLIWLNINSFVLLIGFELNVSIGNARYQQTHELEFSETITEYEKYYPQIEEFFKDN